MFSIFSATFSVFSSFSAAFSLILLTPILALMEKYHETIAVINQSKAVISPILDSHII